MKRNLELLGPYEPNTIENIKKQRESFIKDIQSNDIIGHITNTRFRQCYSYKFDIEPCIIELANNACNMNVLKIAFKGHSLFSSLILNSHIKQTEKIDYIVQLYDICSAQLLPTPRDRQFAQLELYERKYIKIMFLHEVRSHIEQIMQQRIPDDIIRYIGMLIFDTEKSLL